MGHRVQEQQQYSDIMSQARKSGWGALVGAQLATFIVQLDYDEERQELSGPKFNRWIGGPQLKIHIHVLNLRHAIRRTPSTRRVASIRKHFACIPGRQWTSLREAPSQSQICPQLVRGRTAENQSGIQRVRNIEHSLSFSSLINNKRGVITTRTGGGSLLHSTLSPIYPSVSFWQ